MTEPATSTVDAPGATLTYDVRGELTEPGAFGPLLMIGSPMGAAGFASLASHFTDRPVITYDPRGVERSIRTDGGGALTPQAHADDLHLLVTHLGIAPTDVFASSGGAINALAWASRHPGDIRTLVAHEPPLVEVLEDRDVVQTILADMHDTYLRDGMGAAMAKFIGVVSHQGLFGSDYLSQPAPDPAAFGLPAEDDGSRDDPLLGQNLLASTGYQLDVDAVAGGAERVVLARGEESGEELAARGAAGVASRLGSQVTMFPSGHAGFLGGEYGQTGKPEEFAARLREVLDAS